MKQAQIISFANQKGGTGKSTTAATIASGFFKKGYKVLLIDADPQGNTSYSSGAETATEKNLYGVMDGRITAADVIQTTQAGYDIIVSLPHLANADKDFGGSGSEYYLRNALKPIRGRYDYILIDCPPALGTLTVNALTASDAVIAPVGADAYSIQGLLQLNRTVDAIRTHANKQLRIAGILITQYNSRSRMAQDVRQELAGIAAKIGTKLYNTVIRSSAAVREAQARRQSLLDYAPRSTAAADYKALVEEIITSN